MSFVRSKKIKGNRYFYLVQNKRVNGRVMQKVLQYYGTKKPPAVSSVTAKRAKASKKKLTHNEKR